jgi:hypothetical protein
MIITISKKAKGKVKVRYIITLVLFLFIGAWFQPLLGQDFLVKNNGDTIFLTKPLKVEEKEIPTWRNLVIEGLFYKTKDLRCMQLNNTYYVVLNNRFWKRVVHGKINVYALRDQDTVERRKGVVRKLFIQEGDEGHIMPYSNKNLFGMSVNRVDPNVQSKLRSNGSAKAMIVSGAVIMGASALVLFAGALIHIYYPENAKGNTMLAIGGVGVLVGVGSLTGGFFLKSKSKRISLKHIRAYNNQ